MMPVGKRSNVELSVRRGTCARAYHGKCQSWGRLAWSRSHHGCEKIYPDFNPSHKTVDFGETAEIIYLYIFADKYSMPSLKNTACDAFYNMSRGLALGSTTSPFTLFGYVWENTTPTAKLRKLMIDVWIWFWICKSNLALAQNWEQLYNEDQIPRDICLEIMGSMMVLIMNRDLLRVFPLHNPENFHEDKIENKPMTAPQH